MGLLIIFINKINLYFLIILQVIVFPQKVILIFRFEFEIVSPKKILYSMLIKYNGDANIVNPNDGNTAFHYAIMNENQEAIFVLLSKGNCDLSIKNKKKGIC